MRDEAVSTVVGAIVILGILGTAIVYVNAYQVPRQGASLEVSLGEDAERALLQLAQTLVDAGSPTVVDVPLRAQAGSPPLLSGAVLSPARVPGALSLDVDAPVVRLSVLVDAPPGGVPSNDPMRRPEGALMRVYLLGNATRGTPGGSLGAEVGGGYVESTRYSVELGTVLARRDGGSALVAPPAMSLQATGAGSAATTSFSWTVPLLGGSDATVGGGSTGQIGLTPGPRAMLGGGTRVHNLTLEVNTTSVSAWRQALEDLSGGLGDVNVTLSGPPDNGTVAMDVLRPPGATGRAVELRLYAVRHEVALAERAG